MRPTWLLQAGDPGYYRSIGQPALDRTELPAALGSEFARGALGLGRVNEQVPGPGRRLAGSDRQSELESSSAFLLLTWSCAGSRKVRASPPAPLGRSSAEALVVLVLVAARVFFFFPAATAFLSYSRNTGDSSMLLIALIKASSSCLSIAPTARALLPLPSTLYY